MLLLAVLSSAALLGSGESDDFTKQILVDSTGTVGFDLRRTIEIRTPNADPVILARESLHAQIGLCPKKTEVQSFKISSTPPILMYEARIRCF